MKQILNNIKESLLHVPYTFKHICVLYKLQWKYVGYIKFPFHDMDKLFMYIFCGFLGVKKISKIHRKYASHHLCTYFINQLSIYKIFKVITKY